MELKVDNLSVKISKNRILMGTHAASEAATCLKRLLEEQETANIIFAAAPSQNEFLDALSKTEGIDWRRVNAFHMDEYIGLDKDAPQGFGNFLREHIFFTSPFPNCFFISMDKRITYRKHVRNIQTFC
jgi:glucosamine-6-phosphate deaminase